MRITKINKQPLKTNGKFAYDGCHKIYILEDDADVKEAKSYGYEIKKMSELIDTWEKSCPLRFIDNWKLDIGYVEQFQKAKFELTYKPLFIKEENKWIELDYLEK